MASNDEDDIDDLLESTLDDLEKIDQNHATQKNTLPTTNTLPKPAPTTSTSTTTTTTTSTTAQSTDTDKQDEELADQFAKQMAEILKTFQSGDLEKNIEEIVKNIGLKLPEELGGGNNGGEGSSGGTNDEAADLSTILSAFAALDASPQGQGQGASTSSDNNASKISDRLKEIAENAKNKGVGQEDMGGEDLEKMLQDFDSNPEFQSVMEGMVNQMISKDVLYEPMKELREKYPKWLADNHTKLAEEEYGKYIKQYDIVQKICCVYEASGETTTTEQMQEVVQLMQDMAEYGQPPADMIKELAPGVQIGPDGVPVFPGSEGGEAGTPGCNIM